MSDLKRATIQDALICNSLCKAKILWKHLKTLILAEIWIAQIPSLKGFAAVKFMRNTPPLGTEYLLLPVAGDSSFPDWHKASQGQKFQYMTYMTNAKRVQASPLSNPVLFRPLRDHLAWIALAVALAESHFNVDRRKKCDCSRAQSCRNRNSPSTYLARSLKTKIDVL